MLKNFSFHIHQIAFKKVMSHTHCSLSKKKLPEMDSFHHH